MSGLCGWLAAQHNLPGHQQWLDAMAGPLRNTATQSVESRCGKSCALAVTSPGKTADLFQDGDVFVAVSGLPYWTDSDFQQLVQGQGQAKALASAYRQKGLDALKLLRGSYAVAIVRENREEAVLAVDWMGTHPLSYAVSDGQLVFGSSADCVRAHPAIACTVNHQAIFDYFYFNMVPSPRSIYVEQRKLEPAQYLHFSRGRITTGYHWLPAFQDTNPASLHELGDELHEVLRRAVKRSAPDCNAAAFLSGGLDSTTVAGVFSELCQSPVNTYSIGFDVPGYDETEYARIAAARFKLSAHEYYVTPKDVADATPLIAQAYDEPFGNSSAIPVYHCARFARQQGVDVMLAGDGGDELFAGNKRYVKQKIFEQYSSIPSWLRHGALEPLAFSTLGKGFPPVRKLRSYIQQARIPLPQRLETYNLLHMLPLTDIFDAGFLESIDSRQPLEMLQKAYSRSGSHSPLNNMLYLDWKFTLADNDLRKVNRMCEVSGIDVRYPMLDNELIELSARIPPDLKIKGFKLRYFFKQALKDFLPAEIIAKRKQGFGLPFGEWLQSSPALQEMANDSLRGMKSRGYLRPEFIDRIIHSHRTEHAGFYGSMLWTIMMLELWLRSHTRR